MTCAHKFKDGAMAWHCGYRKRFGPAIFFPITKQGKGYPFEVKIPDGLEVSGVVLSDQVKSLDWRIREATLLSRLPESNVAEVIQ